MAIWHVQCKRKVGGGGNVRALARFPASSPKRKEELKVSNLTDWYIYCIILYCKCNASCTQIVGRNGRPAGTHGWVPMTDGLLAFRSLIILERSDAWLCLGRRSPSMCPHATGTWIAACGFQGQPHQVQYRHYSPAPPLTNVLLSVFQRGHRPALVALKDFNANMHGCSDQDGRTINMHANIHLGVLFWPLLMRCICILQWINKKMNQMSSQTLMWVKMVYTREQAPTSTTRLLLMKH